MGEYFDDELLSICALAFGGRISAEAISSALYGDSRSSGYRREPTAKVTVSKGWHPSVSLLGGHVPYPTPM